MKKVLLLLGIGLILALIIFYLASKGSQSRQAEKFADEQFILQIGSDMLLDQGLSVEIFNIHRDFGSSYPTDMTFMVANLSTEVIIFPDSYYGVTVYTWNSQSSQWVNPHMNFQAFQLESILQPGDKTKITPRNSFTLFGEDFIDRNLSTVRILISGTGASSGIKYGDYIDVNLTNP
ncbi:MAG TPA: hypothetical protein PK530_19405 [Anaerolineales bacterium]|nr:hypothetical protein [Anaerolineales bacterium]